MFILRFTVENHRSFRDETELVLVKRHLQTARPQDGTWSDSTNRVAAIYGANASGKSGLLDAFEHVLQLLRSRETDTARRRLPYTPFALDEQSRGRPSKYMIDFVLEDTHYQYGIRHTDKKIVEEWLYSYPTGRRRVLFERGGRRPVGINFGRALKGGEVALRRVVGSADLVLTKGAELRNEQLEELHHTLVMHLSVANFGEADRQERLRSVVEDVADGTLAMEDLQIMLKVADIGISSASVTEAEPPAAVRRILRALYKAGRDEPDHKHDVQERVSPSDEEQENDELFHGQLSLDDEQIEEIISQTARFLMFQHLGSEDKTYPLPTRDQSTGTLTWLSLAAPALRMIRIGGVLAVDELDASLHPQLAQVMIEMFRDKRINAKGAQLIFTTHDTYFMSPTSDVRLTAEEVWFAEKKRDGASELFCLADFPTRGDHNFSRRYLQGRYGAVPAVAPAFLEGLTRAAELKSIGSGEDKGGAQLS